MIGHEVLCALVREGSQHRVGEFVGGRGIATRVGGDDGCRLIGREGIDGLGRWLAETAMVNVVAGKFAGVARRSVDISPAQGRLLFATVPSVGRAGGETSFGVAFVAMLKACMSGG